MNVLFLVVSWLIRDGIKSHCVKTCLLTVAGLNFLALEAMAHGRVLVVKEVETRWFPVQERVELVDKRHSDHESGRGSIVGDRGSVDVGSGHYS